MFVPLIRKKVRPFGLKIRNPFVWKKKKKAKKKPSWPVKRERERESLQRVQFDVTDPRDINKVGKMARVMNLCDF